MTRWTLRKLGIGVLSIAVLVVLSTAEGSCPDGALVSELAKVTTSFGTFEVQLCAAAGDAAKQEAIYTFTVRNVDLACPITSFAVHPIVGAKAELSPSFPWQASNEEPAWWIWDGASWSSIAQGASRVFVVHVFGAPGAVPISGAVFTTQQSSCGTNELAFAFPGPGGGTATLTAAAAPGSGETAGTRSLCTCPAAASLASGAASGIKVLSGYRAEYFIPPSMLNCSSDVVVGLKGEIYVAAAGSQRILLISPDGTPSVYAEGIGAYALDVDARGQLYGYSMPSGEVVAISSGVVRLVSTLPTTAYESTLAAAPDGTLFVGFNDSERGSQGYSSGASTLYRIPPGGGEPQIVRSGMDTIFALDVDREGRLYGTFKGAVWAINRDTGATTPVKYLTLEESSHHGLVIADDGSIFVSSGGFSQSGSIYRISPGSMLGQVTRIASFDGNGIQGIALTAEGGVVGVQRSIGGLQLVQPDGVVKGLVHPNGLVTPQSMAFSPCGDLLIVCDEAGWVAAACPDGVVRTFASMCSFRPPQTHIAFSSDGWFAAGESAPGMPSELNVYSPDGSHRTLATDLPGVSGVAVAPDGTIYTAATAEDRVYRVSPDGRRVVLVDKLPRPQGLALAPDGVLYVIVQRQSGKDGQGMPQWGDAIVRVQPSGLVSPFVSIPRAAAITVGPDGRLYVAAGSAVIRVDPTGSSVSFASGFKSAKGVAFDAAGNLYVSDEGESMIVRISGTEVTQPQKGSTTEKSGRDS